MSVGSHDRHVEHRACKDIGSPHTSANHCGSCAVQSGIRTLGAAQTKFHDAITLCGEDNAGGLGGDKALMVDNIQDCRLHELRFHDGSDDLYDRFLRENNGPFGNRVNISAEMKTAQIVEKVFAENPQFSQIVNIFIGKMKVLNIFNDLLQTSHDGIAALVRILTEKYIKDGSLIFLCLKIALHHGKLIQVCQQCKIVRTHNFLLSDVLCP